MTKRERIALTKPLDFPYVLSSDTGKLWSIKSKSDERIFINHANPKLNWTVLHSQVKEPRLVI